MVLKIINATEARVGTNLTLEGEFYTVKNMDMQNVELKLKIWFLVQRRFL